MLIFELLIERNFKPYHPSSNLEAFTIKSKSETGLDTIDQKVVDCMNKIQLA